MKFAAVATPPTAIGATIMALGIFHTAALQRLPGGPPFTRPLAAVLVLAWAAIALALLWSGRRGWVAAHVGPVEGSFAIGTWVAGTAVLARVMMLAFPGAPWPAAGFFLLSVVVWALFIPLALGNLVRVATERRWRATGAMLLPTVATQAVALMALRLVPDIAPIRSLVAALMALGAACYVAGFLLMLRRYAGRGGWRLATDWDNTNCILHGALSITGLAAVVCGFIPGAAILALWTAAVAMFAIVEAIELARAQLRVRMLGWRHGLFVHDMSQWARNFTFGMLYAFTLAFAQRFPLDATHPGLNGLREAILAYGQYVVLLLLIAELLLLLSSLTSGD